MASVDSLLAQLGLNCHVLSKPKPYSKRVEIEVLLEQIHHLAKDGKVEVNPNIQPELISEANRSRGSFTSKLLKKRHFDAAKRLRSNKDITVRRADKAAVFVLISTDEYLSKIDDILMDSTKFKRIHRDPTLDIIRSTNKTIDAINAKNGGVKLTKISGDFKPGYLYGNVKTHKPGNPLLPIISQIPTPTYNLAKFLNQLLTPFIPTQHSYVSSKDFLDSINDAPARGIISSLDVEFLFTNVPIIRTINYICDTIYR
ncbi:uncharacterized protein LOC143040435 [Oratosquilla oratoria]|uniref:uncharacterized protein LOC143040435 n=1 Tax=Oratosquilla oratoria TaxID=337810 RepID=UPI003F765EFE